MVVKKRGSFERPSLNLFCYKEVNGMHEYHLYLKQLVKENKISKEEMITLLKENNYFSKIKCSFVA